MGSFLETYNPFFIRHFIRPSMGDLEVEQETLIGSVLCQIAYGTVL